MLSDRAEQMKEILSEQAGKDPLQDRFHSGYIAAVKDMLLVNLEEVN